MRFVGIRGYYYLFMKQNIQFSLYSHNYAINNFALDYKILLRTFMLSHSPSVNHKTEMNTYYHKVNTRKVRANLKADSFTVGLPGLGCKEAKLFPLALK